MKNFIPFLFLFLSYYITSFSQTFDFSLTGTPLNTAGWDFPVSSYIDNDMFIMTDPIADQNGYIFYNTPQNLTSCSQFTVKFDFRITNSASPTADGLAFFYISTPPSGFISGEGIGLPTNPEGLILVLDTYDNNSTPDNPLVSLRNMPGTADYIEGSQTGLLTPELTNQDFITDGSWHSCELIYSFGEITVSFDGNPPVLIGNTTLNINGYFGFCSSTGGSWAKHAIKNVHILGIPEPEPPITSNVEYCQFETAIELTAEGSELKWYNTEFGGNPLPSAPIPNTDVPGIFTWYVAEEVPDCNIESTRSPIHVTVHAPPPNPTFDLPIFCSGNLALPISILTGENILWYEDEEGGVGNINPPDLNTSSVGSFVFYATQTDINGCVSERAEVIIDIHQTPIADFNHEYVLLCDGTDTIQFLNNSKYSNNYLWRFSNPSAISNLSNPKHGFNNSGIFETTLIAYNDFCKDSITKYVEIGFPLEADFDVSKDTICLGEKVIFQNQSISSVVNGMNATSIWHFGDGNTSVEENPEYTYQSSGTHEVLLITSNGIPCSDTAKQFIVVDPLPNINIFLKDSVICKGDYIQMDIDHTDSGFNYFEIEFGDGNSIITSASDEFHSYNTAGAFIIKASANYRVCGIANDSFPVYVNEVPKINLGSDTSLCLDGKSFNLFDSENQNNTKALWKWNTGDTSRVLTVTQPGNYNLTVTLNGCSSTEEIKVLKDCYLNIPNSFTPNNDGNNDYFLPRQYLSKGAVSFKMKIFNRWGQIIFETSELNGRGWDGKFNDKDQPMGVYIYQIDIVYKNERIENYTGNVTLIR